MRPGLIDTDIHLASGIPDRLARTAKLIPMKRAGTVEEVAAAILWLASPAASYVTGAILAVAGGVRSHQRPGSLHLHQNHYFLLALRAGDTLLIMRVVSGGAYLSSYFSQ